MELNLGVTIKNMATLLARLASSGLFLPKLKSLISDSAVQNKTRLAHWSLFAIPPCINHRPNYIHYVLKLRHLKDIANERSKYRYSDFMWTM